MSYQIKVLQIGTDDFRETYKIPDNITWEVAVPGEDWHLQEDSYNVIWITTPVGPKDGVGIWKVGEDYRILYQQTKELLSCNVIRNLKKIRTLMSIAPQNTQSVIDNLPKYFFDTQYGDKLTPDDCDVLGTRSLVTFRGHDGVTFEGDFGERFHPVVSWRHNVVMRDAEPLEIWLEYEADPEVELELVIRGVPQGGISTIAKTWRIGEGLKTPWSAIIDDDRQTLWLSFTLRARGKGKLKVGNLHRRYSRVGSAVLLPGGKKDQDSSREEFFSLFEPGDRKPPLAVYFSGYRTAEGFEGYRMMKNLGIPFLLIADPRLEGGAFYVGSEEYEDKIKDCIQGALDNLGFSNEQLILSGLSMGSFAAVYYGADLRPHSIIVGKPLMNLGNVAENERLLRPGGFPTSLDLLLKEEDGMGPEEIRHFNDRLWDKIEKADLAKTDFVISYMKNDDYDPNGYSDLIEHLTDKEANIYGKGIIGRHNDNTTEVVEWFVKRYKRILERSFGR